MHASVVRNHWYTEQAFSQLQRLCPALPGVCQPPSSVRGTCIVVPHAALLAVPDAPPRFFAHRARSAPVPQGAPVCEPSQVQCCTLADRGPGAHSPGRSAMASPSQVQCCTLADHSPGAHSRAFASRLHRPLGAAAGEPSQVQCCTLADHSPENRPSRRIPKRNRPHKCGVCFVLESGSVLLSRAFGHGFFASTGRRHGLT